MDPITIHPLLAALYVTITGSLALAWVHGGRNETKEKAVREGLEKDLGKTEYKLTETEKQLVETKKQLEKKDQQLAAMEKQLEEKKIKIVDLKIEKGELIEVLQEAKDKYISMVNDSQSQLSKAMNKVAELERLESERPKGLLDTRDIKVGTAPTVSMINLLQDYKGEGNSPEIKSMKEYFTNKKDPKEKK